MRCFKLYKNARLKILRIALSLSVVSETSATFFAERSDRSLVLRLLFAEKQKSSLNRHVLISINFYRINCTASCRLWSSEVRIEAGLFQSGQTKVAAISSYLIHASWSPDIKIWMSIKAMTRNMESASWFDKRILPCDPGWRKVSP